MVLILSDRLKVRAMVYVASEPIPRFWPMRTFIHHNPLYGLEDRPFTAAVAEGSRLFHARGYLDRGSYQDYRRAGKIDDVLIGRRIDAFLAGRTEGPAGLDLKAWLWQLMTATDRPRMIERGDFASGAGIRAALEGRTQPVPGDDLEGRLRALLEPRYGPTAPVYRQVDALFGTTIGATVDDLVTKSCLDFFDEGQSAWQAPGREAGFFQAWKGLARRNVRFLLRGLHLRQVFSEEDTAEGMVAYILRRLEVPEAAWQDYITHELTRMHGWAGFIRYRMGAKHYYWAQRYPADLVDFLAVRMVLGFALLQEGRRRHGTPASSAGVAGLLRTAPVQAYLRHELYGGTILPAWAHKVDDALARARPSALAGLAAAYVQAKADWENQRTAQALRGLARTVGADAEAGLAGLAPGQIDVLVGLLRDWEEGEGPVWLEAMESHYIGELAARIRPPAEAEPPATRRPFAQALFCIDVRSERMRRHLESLGDYQTFGIAGFFGVPLGYLEYGKGSEAHLCPAVQTPKNLVLEIPAGLEFEEEPLFTALEHVLHELKASVLSPFVAVEAVGLLFSLGLVGRTLAPLGYHRFRSRMRTGKPITRLLLDKLSIEQADSIMRAVQRAMIVRALARELSIPRDQVTDDDVRNLREVALGNEAGPSRLAQRLGMSQAAEHDFLEKLRSVYRIDRAVTSLQMGRLGRIGFSVEEQVRYVTQALLSIGLDRNFSRFVLLIGHMSHSENNPYESALDCGACGGGKGLPNARALAAMANKPEIRRRLRERGIVIPEDTWFVPAIHNTTTDVIELHDLDMLPARHLLYLERLRSGLAAAGRCCAAERMPLLDLPARLAAEPFAAAALAQRQAHDWSQVRPEWGLARNVYAIVGRRVLTEGVDLEARAFLQSYDYRLDPKGRLLENILTGPLVVGEWINLEHYFSVVDTESFGSGSKVYHNVAGRFAVMTGNQSDLRTGLPSQTVVKDGRPYHEPVRLIAMVEAPLEFARRTVARLAKVQALISGGWVRLVVLDPEDDYRMHVLEDGGFHVHPRSGRAAHSAPDNPVLEASPCNR
ncbi:DUF2309 domain-containing protein [Acidiferrobacter sp.]|uniref:DUF2309 domain-containing protein n=1 Tax=Acidiferrobacter sp. TaxID=1872107 RepID=UPI00260CEF11|nr:DUF2309 domain-containing protein [Acidiferrobacter sp.]